MDRIKFIKQESLFNVRQRSVMSARILVIEDDLDIAESIRYNLQRDGFETIIAHEAKSGATAARRASDAPALIILDLMLPEMSGLDLCQQLKTDPLTRNIPILILSAKAAESDKIMGFELGADDYVTKPFSVKELLSRVRALLRRTERESLPNYDDGNLSIDFGSMRVACNTEGVTLTRKEFMLLMHLVRNRGRVCTRQSLLEDVWGYKHHGDGRTLDVHVRRLRQKLGGCAHHVETIVGIGYRFSERQENRR